MLHMILGILKVIGLIIGILLLLLLSVLLALIFVPVRYKLTAKVLPGQYAFSLRGSWLLHIVSASVNADSVNGRRITLRLFGIRLPLFQPEDDTGEREDRDGRGEIESRAKKRKTRDTEKKETEDTGKKETGNTEKKKGKKKRGAGKKAGQTQSRIKKHRTSRNRSKQSRSRRSGTFYKKYGFNAGASVVK